MESLASPFVFLSYASPDRSRAIELYETLSAHKIRVWLDAKCLLPGQNWAFELNRALDAATVVVLLISRNSVNRTGYVQRELRLALEKLQYRPIHRIYAIPVILDDDLEIPQQVSHLQCLRYSSQPTGEALVSAIRAAFGEVADYRDEVRDQWGIEWSFASFKEVWEGLPGYECEVSWPLYRSDEFPLISHVSDIIKAEMEMMVARYRGAKLNQHPEYLSFGEHSFRRTDSLSVTCQDPMVKTRVLSQHATIYTYGAGAAHGYQTLRSWVFVLDPLTPVEDLSSIFLDRDAALRQIQSEVRPRLAAELEHQNEEEPSDFDRALWSENILQGTADWDAFQSFGFDKSGLILAFPPYQVAAYAFGIISVTIPYEPIRRLLRRPFADALGIGSKDAPVEPLTFPSAPSNPA